ncbi:MAG: type II toxin-antitoxin system YafQ family toxin [Chlorobiaceae bacterium]
MRSIKYTNQFRRDLKRERSGIHGKILEKLLTDVTSLLLRDEPLPQSYCDHPLKGKWNGYHDCHIKPDLIVIYNKTNTDIIELIRLGSHSELNL